MKRVSFIFLAIIAISIHAFADELIRFGDFEQWIVRSIPESRVLGGKTKTIFEIGPSQTINGAKAYKNVGGSMWATSNVYARVAGINKASCAVVPDKREDGGRCCHMATILEECKVLGVINMDVLVSGSIFLGSMSEPISSTKTPYAKMEMGVPYTRRPKALVYDYKVSVPQNAQRIRANGFNGIKKLEGNDNAEIFLLLQRRWEDENGNLFANRVGTVRNRYSKSTAGWVNGHAADVLYGDITKHPQYHSYMGLIPASRSYYARNSKGKMVPVKEVGWDSADAIPTHLLIMASSGCGVAFEGTVGMNFWVDNIKLRF